MFLISNTGNESRIFIKSENVIFFLIQRRKHIHNYYENLHELLELGKILKPLCYDILLSTSNHTICLFIICYNICITFYLCEHLSSSSNCYKIKLQKALFLFLLITNSLCTFFLNSYVICNFHNRINLMHWQFKITQSTQLPIKVKYLHWLLFLKVF